MRTQILIFLIFTVYCTSQINADSKHSVESHGIDRLAKRGVFKATALAEDEKPLDAALGPIGDLVKKIVKAVEDLLNLEDPEKDPLGVIGAIVRKLIALLNEILPRRLQLTIIKLEITNNVIIIKIGQGDVPVDPPTPPTDPEDPPTPPTDPPTPPAYPSYPPVYYQPTPPLVQPIYYKQPSRPIYLSKPTYIFVKPGVKPNYGSNYGPNNNNALDSIAY